MIWYVFLKDMSECVMYADDCAVVISAETREEVCEKLEKVILNLNRWFKSNNLLMNLGKTHFMPIRKSYLSTHCWELKLKHFETKTVTQKGSHKFLGVIVDQFFKWKENTEKLVSELRSLGYIFRKYIYKIKNMKNGGEPSKTEVELSTLAGPINTKMQGIMIPYLGRKY